MAAVERRSAIWSPLNRRLILRAVKHPNGATHASSDSAVMTQRLVDHWARVFRAKSIDQQFAQSYIEQRVPLLDFAQVAPPSPALL
eukprot:3890353-Pyramimonas_sp.AAC.1